MEYKGATETAAFEAIEERLRQNTRQLLDNVKQKQVLPRQAAIDLALQRIKRAVSYKRWSVF
jgi:glutamate dehydrogenase (NAD(P)+)